MIYKAFVSYSHSADGKLAPALQASLQQFAKPWNRLRAMRVFVDTASLSANPALWPTIERSLRESEFFILLASPASARSSWVQKEVECWLGLGRLQQLLIVLTEGEIAWSPAGQTLDRNGTTALPPAVHEVIREEPLYIDLRWARNEVQLSLQNPRFADAVADLAATIRGVSKDDLHGEHVSQHRKLVRLRRLAIASLVALTLSSVVAAVVALSQRNEARRQAQIALGRQLAAQAEVTRTERAQLLPFSLLQGIESMRAFPSVEADQAIRTALARIPVVAAVMLHASPVDAIAVDSATGHIATATSGGVVALWDRTGGEERRLTTTRQPDTPILFSPNGTLLATIDVNQDVRVWNMSTGREEFPSLKLDGRTMRLAFSPDSRMLAATSVAGPKSGVTIWDAAAGTTIEQMPLRGAEESQGLAFSIDGRLAVVDYARVRVWYHAGTWREMVAPTMSPSAIADLRYSPDGKYLVAAGTGRLLVLAGGETHGGSTLDVRGLRHIVFSADGMLLAGAAGNQAIVWETENWAQVTVVTHEDEITSVAFNPSGSVLATGSADGTAALWSIPGGEKLNSMDHGDRVSSVAFLAGPEGLVTASADGTARIWQPRAEVELAALEGSADDSETTFAARVPRFVKIAGASLSIWRGEESRVDRVSVPEARRSAALSANGERAAVAGAGDVVRVWEASAEREIASLPHPGPVDWTEYERRVGIRRDISNASLQRQMSERQGAVNIAGFSADGQYLLTTRHDFVARLWDVASSRLIASQPYQSAVTKATFSPDGRLATLILDGKELLVLGLPDGRKLFSAKGEKLESVAISAPGDVIALVEEVKFADLRVRLWRSSDWSSLPDIAFKSRSYDVALSADGEFVSFVDDDNVARILRTRSSTEVARFTASGGVVPVFSPDSTLVAVGDAQRTVHIFDLRGNRERMTLAHNEDTPLIAFTPDSRFVATVGRTFVRILSTDNGQEAARLRNSKAVERIQFSHDGKYVATTDADSTRIWLWTPDDMAAAGCTRLRRRLQPPQWPPIAGEPFATRLARACPGP